MENFSLYEVGLPMPSPTQLLLVIPAWTSPDHNAQVIKPVFVAETSR